MSARSRIQAFLLFEAVTFVVASVIHAGLLVGGYAHHAAHLAEAVIALVLLVSLAWTALRPVATRAAGLAGQGFALLGTLVGLFTIAVGVGPRTAPDLAYHALIVVVLAGGLVVAARAPRG